MKDVKVGDAVTYYNPLGKPVPALVTAVHGRCLYDADGNAVQIPSINIVFVSGDDDRGDTYGRQIERETSVVYRSDQSAHGNFWEFRD